MKLKEKADSETAGVSAKKTIHSPQISQERLDQFSMDINWNGEIESLQKHTFQDMNAAIDALVHSVLAKGNMNSPEQHRFVTDLLSQNDEVTQILRTALNIKS